MFSRAFAGMFSYCFELEDVTITLWDSCDKVRPLTNFENAWPSVRAYLGEELPCHLLISWNQLNHLSWIGCPWVQGEDQWIILCSSWKEYDRTIFSVLFFSCWLGVIFFPRARGGHNHFLIQGPFIFLEARLLFVDPFFVSFSQEMDWRLVAWRSIRF